MASVEVGSVSDFGGKSVPVNFVFGLPRSVTLEVPPGARDPRLPSEGYSVFDPAALGIEAGPIVSGDESLLREALTDDSGGESSAPKDARVLFPPGSRAVKIIRDQEIFIVVRIGDEYVLLRGKQAGEEFETPREPGLEEPITFVLESLQRSMSVKVLERDEERVLVQLPRDVQLEISLRKAADSDENEADLLLEKLNAAATRRSELMGAVGLTAQIECFDRLDAAKTSGDSSLIDFSGQVFKGLGHHLDDTVAGFRLSLESAHRTMSTGLFQLAKGSVGIVLGEKSGLFSYLIRTPSGSTLESSAAMLPKKAEKPAPQTIHGFIDGDALRFLNERPGGFVGALEDVTPVYRGVAALRANS